MTAPVLGGFVTDEQELLSAFESTPESSDRFGRLWFGVEHLSVLVVDADVFPRSVVRTLVAESSELERLAATLDPLQQLGRWCERRVALVDDGFERTGRLTDDTEDELVSRPLYESVLEGDERRVSDGSVERHRSQCGIECQNVLG
jgi:hypothetical protein